MEITSRWKPEGLASAIHCGKHELTADVEVALGGADSGPDPHDLLAAALAACTSITCRMYAVRKAWPLTDLQVTVNYSHDEHGYHYVRNLRPVGNLNEEQLARLLDIANKCPVHKTLTGSISITTQLEQT